LGLEEDRGITGSSGDVVVPLKFGASQSTGKQETWGRAVRGFLYGPPPKFEERKIVCMLRKRDLKATALKGAAIVGVAMVGTAVGAMAVGAMAVGAMAIGALGIGALKMGTGRIEELSIGKLTVDELVIKKRGEEG
jgi:hypothetical protein